MLKVEPYYGDWVASLHDDGRQVALGQDHDKAGAVRDMIRDLARQTNRYGLEWAKEPDRAAQAPSTGGEATG